MEAESRLIQLNILLLMLLSCCYLSDVSGMNAAASQGAWRPGAAMRRLSGSNADQASNISRFSLKNRGQRPNSYASSGAVAGNGDQSYATVPYRRGVRSANTQVTSRLKAKTNGLGRRPGARGMRPFGTQAVARAGYAAGTGYRFDSRFRAPRRTQRGVVNPYYSSDRWGPDPCCIQWCFFRREYFIKPTYCQPYKCCQPKPECCPAERPPCPPLPCVDECGRPQEAEDEVGASQQALEAIAAEYLGEDGLEVAGEYV